MATPKAIPKNIKLEIARELYLAGWKTQRIQRKTRLSWRELQQIRRRELQLGGRRAPNVPLPAAEYLRWTDHDYDPARAGERYWNFCRNRGGLPISTPDEFHSAWSKLDARSRARRDKFLALAAAGKERRKAKRKAEKKEFKAMGRRS